MPAPKWPRTGGLWRVLAGSLLVLQLMAGLAPPISAEETTISPLPASGCASTPGFVSLEGKKVLEIRRAPAARRLDDYIRDADEKLLGLARDSSFSPDQLALRDEDPYTVIGIERPEGFTRQMGIDARSAACFGISRQQLGERYRNQLKEAIASYRESHTLGAWLNGTALAALVLGIYILWWRGQLAMNRWADQWIAERSTFLLQRLTRFGRVQVAETRQLRSLLQGLRRTIHWSVLLLISYLLIPLLLGFFPPTRSIADGLRAQILGVVTGFIGGVVSSIPNLLSIGVILTITILLVRASNVWFKALDHGRLRIPGFYREWALPTGRLAAILIILIGLILAYPYIPGSDSKAFQGAGLLLGALAALGSSAVATNIISGLMLIYTRAFREGDRVDINGTVGVVQDRALLVTRLQTPRNELVSIPNASVIGSSVVNYSFSRREIRQPVAIATTITIGYDVPWRKVHELMLTAAASVEGITKEIEPFVLQTALNDFHISYELTAFVRDADSYRQCLSQVLAALQDQFAAADVEILSPGYHAIRNGNASTVPKPSQPS